jgi:release factor glutamine methyltransferase
MKIIIVKLFKLSKNNQLYTIKQILNTSIINKLDAKILLAHTLGLSKVELILQDDYQLTDKEYQNYAKLHDECLLGKPIAYILGYKEFYSRKFHLSSATLIPRPETELLVDTVLNLAKSGDKILDLGTGSGCIAISLKLENPSLNIIATDNYEETLNIARYNAKQLGASIKFCKSNWFSNIVNNYDIIVSNPPYIAVDDEHLSNLQFEPQFALTDFLDGMQAIKLIIQNAVRYLKKYLLLEHGYNQGDLTRELMIKYGFVEVRTIKDYANIDRVTIGKIA